MAIRLADCYLAMIYLFVLPNEPVATAGLLRLGQ
jgi:hypothetical protein